MIWEIVISVFLGCWELHDTTTGIGVGVMVRLKSHGGRLGNLGSKWRFRAGKIIGLLAGGVSIPILDFPKYRKFMKILYDWDFCTFGPIDTFNLKCKRFQQKVSSLQQFWLPPLMWHRWLNYVAAMGPSQFSHWNCWWKCKICVGDWSPKRFKAWNMQED